jgi:ribosomal protein S18 acetylase RimI-like enzyme
MTDTGDLTIRKAVAADAVGAPALIRAAYSPYLSKLDGPLPALEADYAEEAERYQAWGMDEVGAVISALLLGTADDHMVLVNVAVSPDQQGRGLARGMVEKAEDETCPRGFGELRLFTHAEMPESVDLYTHLGRREYDRQDQAGVSRVLMRKPRI